MQILPLLVAAFAALADPFTSTTRSDPVLVRFVIDGDTIDVAGIGRVRLLGIDAPELGRGLDTSAPFGREARDKLMSLVLHRWVRLEYEGPLLDAYSRRLAYVMTEDGVFVNEALVRSGLARVSARVPLSRLSGLQHAEQEAQSARRGMWGDAPSIAPPSYTQPRQPRRQTPRTRSKTRGTTRHDARHSRRVRIPAQDPRA